MVVLGRSSLVTPSPAEHREDNCGFGSQTISFSKGTSLGIIVLIADVVAAVYYLRKVARCNAWNRVRLFDLFFDFVALRSR